MNNIEILKNVIYEMQEQIEVYEEQGNVEEKEGLEEVQQAIEILIQENKELKEEMGKDLDVVYIKGVYDERDKWKSKVKEKIKEYNIPIFDVLDKLPIMPRTIERGCGAKDGIIYVLQELLEGE